MISNLFFFFFNFLIFEQSVIAVAISRVNQFDAARLDVEMSAMLKEQLVKVFTLAKVLNSIPFFFFFLND